MGALSSPMSPHLQGRGGADRCCRVSAFLQPPRQRLLFVPAHLFKQGGAASVDNGRRSREEVKRRHVGSEWAEAERSHPNLKPGWSPAVEGRGWRPGWLTKAGRMPGKSESLLESESEEKFRTEHLVSLRTGRAEAWFVLAEANSLCHLFSSWLISHPAEAF